MGRLSAGVALLAVLALLSGGVTSNARPDDQALTLRQTRLVVRSYAQAAHLGGFRIVRCSRVSRSRARCSVTEAGYASPGIDRYLIGVKRLGCEFLIRDCGTGQSCTWQRWL